MESFRDLRERFGTVDEVVVRRKESGDGEYQVVLFHWLFAPTGVWMRPAEVLRVVHALGVRAVHFVGGGKARRTYNR